MYVKTEIVVPTALLEANAEAARRSPRLMQVAFDRDMRFIWTQFLKLVAPRGAHRHRKGEMTPKQQRWWFAVGVKKWKGRTGAQQKGWRKDTKTTQAGGVLRVWNVNPSHVFVQGYQQQRMHFGTWVREDAAVKQIQPIAQKRIAESWKTVSDITAGVR